MRTADCESGAQSLTLLRGWDYEPLCRSVCHSGTDRVITRPPEPIRPEDSLKAIRVSVFIGDSERRRRDLKNEMLDLLEETARQSAP
jgi:hypothetical protein